MPSPSRRFSPSLDANASAHLSSARPSLYDNKDDFIERVAPIGMAAIYFGSFSLAPQDAALSRQALYKLSFAYRYFLQPAGLKVAVLRQTALLSGALAGGSRLRELADILARQIEGIAEVNDDTDLPDAPEGESLRESAQFLFATDQTLRSGLKLSQENGKLVLEGEAASATQKSWAEGLAAATGATVESRLAINPLSDPPAGRLPDVDDESLQALILFRLRLVRETEHIPVRISSRRGVVTLQGKVRSEALRQRIENIARSTLGLRELRSSLAIAG